MASAITQGLLINGFDCTSTGWKFAKGRLAHLISLDRAGSFSSGPGSNQVGSFHLALVSPGMCQALNFSLNFILWLLQGYVVGCQMRARKGSLT